MRGWLHLDIALQSAKRALDGLALRQEVIARNLANVDTPGYRAQKVDFEQALQRELGRSRQVTLEVTHPGHLAAPAPGSGFVVAPRLNGAVRADGNDVDVDMELVEMAETGVRYQALTRAIGKKLSLLKAIAAGR